MIGIEVKIPADLLRVAHIVRHQILKNNGGSPHGMCGDAAEQIANKHQKRRPSLKVCSGTFNGGESHCWVEWNNRILDVTADQFNMGDISMAAIVFGTKKQLGHLYKRD